MADSEAGPSDPKRARLSNRRVPLSEQELERMLYESDDEYSDDQFDDSVDSDSDYHVENSSGDGSDEDDEPPEIDEHKHSESKQKQQQLPTVAQTTGQHVAPRPPQWSEDASTMKTFNFTKQMKFLAVPEGERPIDFFNMVFDEHLFDLIVRETNSYAEEVFLSPTTTPKSRITRWRSLTTEELQIFIGVLLHMGNISLKRLNDYWKTSRFYRIPFFAASISRDRFLLIMRCLHFARNPREDEPLPDRLFKIQPLIDYFNNKMAATYYPGQNLSLDESMGLWRGRLSYIKNKHHNYGIKLYVLTEPDGTALKFAVYTGHLDDFGGKGHAANVVLQLMEGRLHVGHSVYMDNCYNSHDLAIKLLNRKTYCTGTLRLDRKNNPVEVRNAKLKKRENISKISDDGVLVGKWRDKRDVAYISTEFADEMVTYKNKRNMVKEKPAAIFHYNKFMGRVDRKDQLMAYYPCERKCLRWYKKLGIHIIQMLLINAYLLFKKHTESKMTQYDFRHSVLDSLVPKKTGQPINRIHKRHMPEKNPLGANGRIMSRRCTWCHNHQKKRKETTYHCPACPNRPHLCIGQCFINYHKNM